MSKINLFFTVFLLNVISSPASAMFGSMRSALKPFAAATVRQLASPKLAKLTIGAGTLYGASHVRSVHALEDQKQGELPDAVKYPGLYKFFVKNQCSEEVRQVLEREKDNVTAVKNMYIQRYNNVPFYKKPIADFERVYNAWRMKRVFKQHNLTTLAVPDKCVCSIGEEWYVIAAAVQRGLEKKYSKKEIEEIIIAADQTRYIDWKGGINRIDANVFRDTDGKLTFIDTEQISFLPKQNARFVWDPESAFRVYIESLDRTEDVTKEWLDRELENKRKNDKPSGWHQKTYDDPDIDFEQVKEQFGLWQQEMARPMRQVVGVVS